ncbi:adenosylcobinamide amidohydrolase [Methanococcoides methylutens]|uniref:adenosylcobinamide amidohydrolase n=1 Tax=Methanococcoides methylutens TaxID=2226 RepID=UPI00404519B3
MIVKLPEGRRTLTTSWLNGGYNEDLGAVFNHMIPHRSHGASDLEGGSVTEYLRIVADRLGLEPDKASGMLTTASMDNAVIVSDSFRGLEVTAIVTGGVEINGGRAGDPSSYYQEDERFEPVGGTVNIILLIGADLPAYSMARALMTATEAKSAALQQLMAPSRYSSGIATGTGTDMIAVVADTTSPLKLTDAGKHSKLGELIGKCVIEAVTKAVGVQSDITPISQRDMLVRMDRFGIDEARYWKVASTLEGENKKTRFIEHLRKISRNPALVAATVSVVHIIDEISWELIPENAGRKAAFSIMRELPKVLDMDIDIPADELLNEYNSILDNWIVVTSWIAKNTMP